MSKASENPNRRTCWRSRLHDIRVSGNPIAGPTPRMCGSAVPYGSLFVGIPILYVNVPATDPVSAVLLEGILQAMDEVHRLMGREKGLAGKEKGVTFR